MIKTLQPERIPSSTRVRAPLTWWRVRGTHGTEVAVRCSSMHVSIVMHQVEADGSLVAPPGVPPSMHCGMCNEELPLKLEGWTADP